MICSCRWCMAFLLNFLCFSVYVSGVFLASARGQPLFDLTGCFPIAQFKPVMPPVSCAC